MQLTPPTNVPNCPIDVPKCPPPAASIVVKNVPQCPPMSPDVPPCPLPQEDPQIPETNPIPAPSARRALTLSQRAAARCLVRGLRQKLIADQLGLNRRTLTRWKRLPDFNAEIERLQALVEKSLKVAGIRAPAPTPQPRRPVPDPLDPPQRDPVRNPAGETFAQAVMRLQQQGFSTYQNVDEYRRRMRQAGFEP